MYIMSYLWGKFHNVINPWHTCIYMYSGVVWSDNSLCFIFLVFTFKLKNIVKQRAYVVIYCFLFSYKYHKSPVHWPYKFYWSLEMLPRTSVYIRQTLAPARTYSSKNILLFYEQNNFTYPSRPILSSRKKGSEKAVKHV